MRRALGLIGLAVVLAGCGGGGGSPSVPVVQRARIYHLQAFRPAASIRAGRPVTVSFTVAQPSGAPLVHYRSGPGPHTGVHLIFVRDDLSTIIHLHPPIGPDGRITQRVIFPKPGPYRVLVDVYPRTTGPGYTNFQLFSKVHVSGAYHPVALPPYTPVVTTGGWTFRIKRLPKLHLAQAALVDVSVRNAAGRPADFTPWFGALGHAIFFHEHDLAYFHTHICAPDQAGCASIGGPTSITGSSNRPGVMHVGVLLPEAGTWRLFLQCKVDGKVLTAPFTLRVAG
ncbi:MAG TPA: hypothetical protein VFX13_14105 [Gaiellales bacterium]|jgi:hypothetical protein|nr:hypothetical protein [Gaiellales bacterium]